MLKRDFLCSANHGSITAVSTGYITTKNAIMAKKTKGTKMLTVSQMDFLKQLDEEEISLFTTFTKSLLKKSEP